MKALLLSLSLSFCLLITHAAEKNDYSIKPAFDTLKLQTENNNAYYQNAVKVDSSIKVSTIYLRALQFMAAKNFQQTYGYAQEGKLIFTSQQDLNINPTYEGDNDDPDPYTVQFSITIDMKNGRYRYTISNVTFYLPTQTGNRRMTLYEVLKKEDPSESRRTIKEARNLIGSFERYLTSLTNQLNIEIEHKAAIYNTKF